MFDGQISLYYLNTIRSKKFYKYVKVMQYCT